MKKFVLLGGVAFLAMGTSAFAQQATGLYVSAGVGANWAYDSDIDADASILGPLFTASATASPDFSVGPMGVVAVGYDWGYLRTEAELGLRTNDLDNITGDYSLRVLGIPVASDNFDSDDLEDLGLSLKGHQRILSVMANALIDFDLGPVTIYGGGGLGIANVQWNLNLSGLGGGVDGDSYQTLLAYQGIAGLAYNVTPQLAITAEYRYFSTFEDARPDEFDQLEDAFNTPFSSLDISDFSIENHSALIGVRYTFAPPAPAVIQEIAEKSYLVFFDFDSSQLTPDAQSIVATAAADALAGNSARLDVTGHTDRSGSDAYNQALSIRRATSVQNALIANGVPADLIVIRGAGESEPLVPTADGVREPQNRRVEIVIN
jgi:outer membrane protein OmpA-like peptidoglycan-associated protein